jgi:hypothetical protein
VNSEQDCHRPPDASAATGIDLGEAKALGARRREFDPAPRRCLPNCTSKLFTAGTPSAARRSFSAGLKAASGTTASKHCT